MPTPQNGIFRNKKITKIRNTSANVSPHSWNKSGRQILPENHRAIYFVHLPYWFRAVQNAVCLLHLTVRKTSNFTTILRASELTQVSSFWLLVTEGHFSWYAFLNVWKQFLFAGDGFAGARSIDSAMLSVINKTFLQMVHWFRFIQFAALWKLRRNFFLLCVFRACAEHSREQICIFLSFAHVQRVRKWLR